MRLSTIARGTAETREVRVEVATLCLPLFATQTLRGRRSWWNLFLTLATIALLSVSSDAGEWGAVPFWIYDGDHKQEAEFLDNCSPVNPSHHNYSSRCEFRDSVNKGIGKVKEHVSHRDMEEEVKTESLWVVQDEKANEETKAIGIELRLAIKGPEDGSLLVGPIIPLQIGMSVVGGSIASRRDRSVLNLELCIESRIDLHETEPGDSGLCFEVELEALDFGANKGTWVEEQYAEVPLRISGQGWHTIKVQVFNKNAQGAQVTSAASRLFVTSEPRCFLDCNHFPSAKSGTGTACTITEKLMGDHLQEEVSSTHFIGLSWTLGGGFGWGTAGMNIALELERVRLEGNAVGESKGSYPVPLHRVHTDGLTVEQVSRLEMALVRGAAVQENLPHRRKLIDAPTEWVGWDSIGEGETDTLIDLPFPVIHCLGRWGPDGSVDTMSLSLSGAGIGFWGTVNVGIIFFESEEPFSVEDMRKLALFDAILAGSSWNEQGLQQGFQQHRWRGIPTVPPLPLDSPYLGVFLQGVDSTFRWDGQGNMLAREARSTLLNCPYHQRRYNGGDWGFCRGKDTVEEGQGDEMGNRVHHLECEDSQEEQPAMENGYSPPGEGKGVYDEFWVFTGGKLEYRKGQDIVVDAFKRFLNTRPESQARLVTAWQNDWPSSVATIAQSPYTHGFPRYHHPPAGSTATSSPTAVPPPAYGFPLLDVRQWLDTNGLPAENVLDLGRVPHSGMPMVLRTADIAVFASRCEGGTNLAAMEAIAVGVPTVLSANTGHLDLIQHVSPGGCLPLWNQTFISQGGGDGNTTTRHVVNRKDCVEELKGVRGDGIDSNIPTAAANHTTGDLSSIDNMKEGRVSRATSPPRQQGCGESSVEDLEKMLEKVFDNRGEAILRGRMGAMHMRSWGWPESVLGVVSTIERIALSRLGWGHPGNTSII